LRVIGGGTTKRRGEQRGVPYKKRPEFSNVHAKKGGGDQKTRKKQEPRGLGGRQQSSLAARRPTKNRKKTPLRKNDGKVGGGKERDDKKGTTKRGRPPLWIHEIQAKKKGGSGEKKAEGVKVEKDLLIAKNNLSVRTLWWDVPKGSKGKIGGKKDGGGGKERHTDLLDRNSGCTGSDEGLSTYESGGKRKMGGPP